MFNTRLCFMTKLPFVFCVRIGHKTLDKRVKSFISVFDFLAKWNLPNNSITAVYE